MVLFPGQTCPEHRHAPVEQLNYPGREEPSAAGTGWCTYMWTGIRQRIPRRSHLTEASCNTVRHEIVLHPGEQYTMHPNTRHWFQAGPDGAVVSRIQHQEPGRIRYFHRSAHPADPGDRKLRRSFPHAGYTQ